MMRGFIAIYSAIPEPDGTSVERVIGYGFGRFSLAPNHFGLHVTKGFGTETADVMCWVGADNVSAHLGDDAPVLDKTRWDLVFDELRSFAYPSGEVSYLWTDIRPGTVLGPALTR
jgi:hypothetical protein